MSLKNAKQVHEVATKVPLDRLLIETDSPYLAPVPHRGKINTPALVVHVAEHIAQLRGVPAAQIAQHTTNNFYTLFKQASPANT